MTSSAQGMDEPSVSPASKRPAVEIGCVIAGSLHPIDFAASRDALKDVVQLLEEGLPEFDWRIRIVHRREVLLEAPVDPMRLLDLGIQERDVGRWDFTFVLTEAELRALDSSFMLGAPSQVADVALLSTSRLDPAFRLEEADDAQRRAVLKRRLRALLMHLFGHLNDLPHAEEREDFMFDLSREMDLDVMDTFGEDAWRRLRARVHEVADPRMEERTSPGVLPFTMAVLWNSRRELLRGIRRIAPWEFPIRYGRLTTAAVSIEVILVVTAEAWELGMSQGLWSSIILSSIALLSASAYLVKRQHLVSHFATQRSEQAVVTSVALVSSVLLGMATTYSMLFVTTWLVAKLLFRPALVHSWTPSLLHVGEAHYLAMSAFIAAMGIIVGALGASFEQESYFRRVTMLDEET